MQAYVDFTQSRFKGIDPYALNCIRAWMMLPNMAMFAASMATNPFVGFFYYLTFWGFIASFVSILASFKATHYPEWIKFAYYSSELAHTLNLIITPLFWIVLAPEIFPTLKWSGIDLFLRVHLTTLHSVPLIGTTINIVLTDMRLQTAHWKYGFVMGLCYMVANGIGTYATGKPLYPIVDWKDP